MAERRMFSKSIIESDDFLDMPMSTQSLYFHLSMRADDDGFVSGVKRTMRMLGASDDDLKILLAKQYLIPFDSGVVVIKHWRIHNYIQKDRYKPTLHTEEMRKLQTSENKAYTTVDTRCIQDGYNLDTQVREGKVSQGESSQGEISQEKHTTSEPQPDTKRIQDTSKDKNKKSTSGKAELDREFEIFWNMYGKKIDCAKCRRKWNKLKKQERNEIFEHVPKYVRATPDKQYRKNPYTYLNSRTWEDEELPTKKPANQAQNTSSVAQMLKGGGY